MRSDKRWWLVAALVCVGCGGGAMEEQGGVRAQVVPSEDEICPAGIAGLDVRHERIENGGALVFESERSDGVREIRERLARFEQLHDRTARGRGPRALVDRSGLIQASAVRVVDIPDGARLEVRASNRRDLGDLRHELTESARDIAQGRCPLSLRLES